MQYTNIVILCDMAYTSTGVAFQMILTKSNLTESFILMCIISCDII